MSWFVRPTFHCAACRKGAPAKAKDSFLGILELKDLGHSIKSERFKHDEHASSTAMAPMLLYNLAKINTLELPHKISFVLHGSCLENLGSVFYSLVALDRSLMVIILQKSSKILIFIITTIIIPRSIFSSHTRPNQTCPITHWAPKPYPNSIVRQSYSHSPVRPGWSQGFPAVEIGNFSTKMLPWQTCHIFYFVNEDWGSESIWLRDQGRKVRGLLWFSLHHIVDKLEA